MKIKEEEYRQLTDEQKIGFIDNKHNKEEISIILDETNDVYEAYVSFDYYVKTYDNAFYEKYKLLFEDKDISWEAIKSEWWKVDGKIEQSKSTIITHGQEWEISAVYAYTDEIKINEEKN